YTRAGRSADALPLLLQLQAPTAPQGTLTGRAIWAAWRGEAYLLAGRRAEASAQAAQALEFARAHQERGHQAWALWLLGAIAAPQEPPEGVPADASYHHALILATELGMRPLQAHCHLGLGTLASRRGQKAQARTDLSAARALYRSMDMPYWL